MLKKIRPFYKGGKKLFYIKQSRLKKKFESSQDCFINKIKKCFI